MSDEVTTDEVIANTQEDSNDFASFEEVDHTIPETPDKEDDGPVNFSDVDVDDAPDKGAEKESKEEPTDSTPKEEPVVDDKEIKMLTVGEGDSKSEIRMDSKVIVPVDGKDVEMTLQDVINKASGTEAVDKRFSELNTDKGQFRAEKASFEADENELLTKVDSFADAVKNQDAVGAINALAALSGGNPVELRNNFKNLLLDQAKAYLNMSEDQQKAFDNEQQVEYHRQESESLKLQNEIQQTDIELENSILRLQARHKLSDAELVSLNDRALVKSVEIDSVEALERFIESELTQEKSSSLLSQVDPTLSGNEKALSIVDDFIAKNPEMSDEDVVEAIKNAMGSEDESDQTEENSLSSKIQNKQQKNLKGKKVDNTEKFSEDQDDEMLSFDELGY